MKKHKVKFSPNYSLVDMDFVMSKPLDFDVMRSPSPA